MKSRTFFALSWLFLLGIGVPHAPADIQKIEAVDINKSSFNPAKGDQVRLDFRLPQDSRISVRVYDPDGGLVQTLMDNQLQTAGKHSVVWDGLDMVGRVVPDEAYTFTIETANGGIYDPFTFSGGIVGDVEDARFSQEGTLSYRLPAAARTLIRLGIHNGPMLKTLVDWKPRISGQITEHWNGKDQNNLINLREHKNFSVMITYVTLPDATVIAIGNKNEMYRDYKLGRAKNRQQKPKRPRQADAELRLQPAHLVPPVWMRAPRVVMSLNGVDKERAMEVPEVQDAVDVRIDVDTSDREFLLQDQFEVIFFVDNIFFAEAERGYLPLNWRWELHQLPAGKHILTVNISSFKGQVGVSSRRVEVVKP